MTDPTPHFDTPPASVALPSVPLTSEPPAPDLSAAVERTKAAPVAKKAAHLAATQTIYPWRSALRAGGATLIGFLLAAAAASPIIGPFVDHYIPGAGAGLVAFGVFCGALAGLINRVANLPTVTSFLTSIHLGPVPKH